MSDKQQQVDHLKEQIDTGAQEAKSYLDTLKKNIREYDEKHPGSHKATDVLRSGIDTAQSSVEELTHVGAKLKTQSKEASDQSMELARETLQKVKTALNALQHRAREYDEKFTGSAGTKVAGDVSDSVESIVNSMRQRTTDAIEMATEQITRMKDSAQNAAGTAGHGVQVAAGEALRVGDKVDEKLGVSEKASGVAGVVTETIKSIDQRMHVTETAAKIDSKVTGGLGARVVNKGVEMVHDSIEYVTETLQQAKIAASKSSTAQAAEEKATGAIDAASANVGMAQDKAMYVKDQVVGAASSARDKTMEMASSARQSAMGAVGMDTSDSMTDYMKEGASNAKETVSDKAGAMKEGAQQTAGSMKQGAQQTAESMKQGAQDMASSAQEKGAEMREDVREGASNAKQSAQETAGSVKNKAQDAAGSAQQKGSEMTGSGSGYGTSYGTGHGTSYGTGHGTSYGTGHGTSYGTGHDTSYGTGHDTSYGTGTGHGYGFGHETDTRGSGLVGAAKETMSAAKHKAADIGTSAKEATMGMSSGESATDEKHKQAARSTKNESTSTKLAGDMKNATADTMSQAKGIMKDATKA